jgi:tetratricopeptide (TPR) repeat protein
MPQIHEFPVRWRIWLPLLAAAALLLAPRAASIGGNLEGSHLAGELSQPQVEATRQISLAVWEPWRVQLWQQAGDLALRGGNPDLAISSLERAEQIGQLDPSGRLALGEAFWTKQLKEQALQVWEPLFQQGKAPPEIYHRAILYRRNAGRLEDAVRLAQAWAQASPSNAEAAYTLGLISLPVAWQQSGAALAAAARLDAGWGPQVKILAQALQRSGADAPEEYRLVEIGRALGSLGEWDLALAAFEHAQAINPGYAEAWAFGSEARQQLHQDGTPDISRALALAPESPVIQALAALDFRRAGDSQQALQRFQAAAELEPQRAIWLVEIGNTYADSHDIRKGLEYYQKAAAVEPENPAIWRLMAQYCLIHQIDLRTTGLPAARQAALLTPNDPSSLDMLGQVMEGLEDYASAERFLQQALDKDLDFPAAHLHLGQLYLTQNKMDWAQYHLAQAASQSQDAESSLIAQRLMARYFGGK